jgi:hypothetical protein
MLSLVSPHPKIHSLGVGAPIPTAQNQPGGAASHHETQRLKNRLVGSGAVRKRAEDAKLNSIDSKRRPSDTGSDEDESESRASAMKKAKTANGKPNGLFVFGSTKAESKSQPAIRAQSIPPPSTPDRSSTSSPQPTAPNQEAMGIHTLPPKLSLAAKIWPRATPSSAPSPTGSDRPQTKRRKVAPMLPPPSPVPLGPELSWNLQPTPLRSPSTGSVTSTVSSQAIGVEQPAGKNAQLGSTAQLSRKEQKRLRREAAQQSVRPESELGQSACGDGPDRDSASEAKAQSSSATGQTGSDDSDSAKRVYRIRENGE